MLVYLTDVRGELVVIIQVDWSANPSSRRSSSSAPLALCGCMPQTEAASGRHRSPVEPSLRIPWRGSREVLEPFSEHTAGFRQPRF
jgi:hypothetical protein